VFSQAVFKFVLLALILPWARVWARPAQGFGQASSGDYLSEEEQDKLRDAAQEPSQRIIVYLDLIQTRLTRFDDYREKPPDGTYDYGRSASDQLDQSIRLTDELKDWIQTEFDHGTDMRAGLRKVVETAPQQLDELQHAQRNPDSYAAVYKANLTDAIEDLTDALDGATKALADQQKKFGELKRNEKEDQRLAKEQAKEDKKKQKEEEKLRKKMRKEHPSSDNDQD
jgi:hypothetical protein